jgi:hypothetical protein
MNYRTYIGALIFLGSPVLSARQHDVPSCISGKAVFYAYTKQLNAFSCGYNVLFNAVNFEQLCGFSHNAHRYDVFSRKVLPYINSKGRDPKQTSYNTDTEYLARTILNLKHFYHLHYDSKTDSIELLLSEKTTITFPRGTTQREIERLHGAARYKMRQAVIDSLKQHLAQNKEAHIHFLCYLTSLSGVRHAVLLTLYQNASGRALYHFDNLNEPLTDSSELLSFIKYLDKIFSISPVSSFIGPVLPARWPHLD